MVRCEGFLRLIYPIPVLSASLFHRGNPDWQVGFANDFFHDCQYLEEWLGVPQIKPSQVFLIFSAINCTFQSINCNRRYIVSVIPRLSIKFRRNYQMGLYLRHILSIPSLGFMKNIIKIFMLTLVLTSCLDNQQGMCILVTGDVLLDRGVRNEMIYHGYSLLVQALSEIKSGDFTRLEVEVYRTNT